ncbi:RDD family protein [Limibacter armeniacum]|uniref:RDD family protein n=1 Tax=Limibacter armeniacum TaxID=466084 RepID=UPI002FE5ABDD
MQDTYPITPASVTKRFIAFVLDYLLISAVMLIIALIWKGKALLAGDIYGDEQFALSALSALGAVLFMCKDLYRGVSPGRWIAGIEVRDNRDIRKVPSIGHLFLRNLFLAVWPVEMLVLLTSKGNARLGDRLAKTEVIDNPFREKRKKRVMVLLVLTVVIYTVISFLIMNSY